MSDHKELDTYIASLPIHYKADFVPQSKSRNAGEKEPSLNWKINISRGLNPPACYGLTTDYMQGIGHAPDYTECGSETRKVYANNYFREMAETGKYNIAKRQLSNGNIDWYAKFSGSFPSMKPIPAPLLRDVLYSLIMDSDVLNHPSFESWAGDFGYDLDSRKAEQTYNACLKIALELKSVLGTEAMEKLKELYQDY